jgi:predicted Zn finger-like uncharacterized protein
MNYITSCPACETQFLLTKEHLKAHRGKVQCGNCEHIFNAKNRLTEISDDIRSPAEYQASIEEQSNDASSTTEEKPISEVLNVVLESVPNLDNLESANTHIDEIAIEANDTYEATVPAPNVIEELTVYPKFYKRRAKPNIWLLLFGLMLAILAGLQTIYYQRTKIAAEYPQFKPYLTQACTVLKCEINLPKNLDFFTIDDSDMQEDETHKNVINFSSLLINNASYTQAYPKIELTLTDTSDQPVLRKIIQPIEYLSSTTNVAAGIAPRDEVRINLVINVTNLAVAGYRVLLVF